MQFLNDCVRAFNPFAEHQNADEARKAARLGSIALIGTAGQSLFSTLFQRSDPEELKALMMKAEGPVSLEAAAVSEQLYSQIVPIVSVMLWVVTVITVVVCGALAWVQWRKLTKIIPMLYLLVFGIGVMAAVGIVLDPFKRILALEFSSVVQALVAVVLAVLMFSAYRGASQYYDLQGDRT